MKFTKLFYLLLLPCHSFANEWVSKYDEWTCEGKMGVIMEQYTIDSFTDNVEADSKEEYNLLCSFSNRMKISDAYYLVKLNYPNCDFTTSNQLFTLKVFKFQSDNSLLSINDADVKLSFPPNTSYFTAQEINRDQNVKSAFVLQIMGQEKLGLSINNLEIKELNLSGIQKGIQNPSCVSN